VSETREDGAAPDVARTLGLGESLADRLRNRWLVVGGAAALL
jgi:hypothetical protein